ncbi:hypothetical protein KY290_017917 [Solanum tuberosum]|uniref:SWIM-type domain-containing protein n=1 Tax=Solanum tuberosum TaxID=4113 RepID=A0ABQ7VE44_SOLTU|nr:hypothetical protein KY290_017917 [Solanum tuberosum]
MLHYGGKWITKPLLVYDKKYVATRRDTSADLLDYDKIVEEYTKDLGFVLVKQILVKGPSGKFYLLEGSEGIKTLQCLLNEQFKVVHFFAVDDFEETVFAPNIIHHSEAYLVECEYGTDAETESDDDQSSDDEYNFDELELIKMLKSKEVNADLSHYKELHPSMTFKDLNEARKIVNLYSLANSKPIVVEKSDRTRLRYKCMIGCPFVLLISQDGKGPGFKVKTLKINHNCEDAFKNPRACTSTLAQYFKSKLQNNPQYKLKDMRKDLKDQFNLNARTSKLKRAKRMALQKLQGSFLDDFNRIEAYANELRLSNPGSDIVINLSKDALEQGKRKFLRMYICFNALKLGWKEGLRPFIGLDGTFLKGQCKGQLLVAMAQDSQNCFYPLAWAVVDKETTRTWIWFLQLLNNSLNLKDGQTVTFMSDMQKGLINAVKTVLPLSHHRYCVRHIEANWMKRFRSGEMKKLLWWAAWSTYEEDFKDQLSALGALSKSAAKDLLKYPPQTWCRAYLDTICKNQMVDNNFTESFNSWILEARGKPILKMLEDIRIKIMNRLREKEEDASKWTTDYSPKCMKLFTAYMRIAQLCSVDFNGDLGYEVSEGEDRHTVNLVEKKCTCRSWQLTGIPCPHAIKAMLYQKIEPKNEINWWYSKEAYLMTYRAKLMPVRGEQFWNVLPEHAIDPPDLVKTVGRPKTKRTREKDAAIKRAGEWAHSRKGTKMTCSKCGETTHNARTCNFVEGEQGPTLKRKKGRTEKESEEEVEEDYDVNSSAPRPTQDEEYHFMSSLQYEPLGPAREPESDPDIRPQVISENRTKLKMRMNQQRATGNRVISFRGDHAGISEPTDLPYSPTNLTWKGKEAVTGNQLERERQKKVDKLKTRKTNGKSQI